jgi:hypothetical protein
MYSRCTRLMAVAAGTAASVAVLMGAPIAHATEADDQFLAVVANLGLEFATPDEAVEAGNNVCDIVSEGSANNISPAEIRSSIITSLRGEGVDNAVAAQLMWGAVDAYCPQYNAVVGD